MAPVDLQRAFQSMTVPPHKPHQPDKPEAVDIAEPEAVAVPIEFESERDCMPPDWVGDDALTDLARKTVRVLRPILHSGPQPLPHCLDLLECEFDVKPGCAERLFWLAQERGYLSLHEGNVYLGRLHATV